MPQVSSEEKRYAFPGNIGALLDLAKDRYPHRDGIGTPERMFTFEACHGRVCRLAHGLRKMGLTRHDRVILSSSDPLGYALFSLAVFRIGAVGVPVNPEAGPFELAHIVKDTWPRLFICNRERLPMASKAFELNRGMTRPALLTVDEKSASVPSIAELDMSIADTGLEEMAPEDTALIIHTAAMDGYPLGARLTHGSLFADTAAFARKSFDDGDRASESLFSILPLFHSYGFTNGFLVPLMAGVPCVLLGTALRGSNVVKLMETHRPTQMVSVPAIFHTLLKPLTKRPELCRGLRNLVSGGIKIPVRLLERYRDKLDLCISEGYGLTEASPVATWNGLDRPPKFGTVGVPLSCCRVRIVDDQGNRCPSGTEGEVLVSGSNLFSGYLNQPDRTESAFSDGWFKTGDLGCLDDENYLTLSGLKKDMINVFGLKAYPKEVERLIMNHPDVTSVRVCGERHRRFGDMVTADIRPRPGSALTERAFTEWCRQHLSPYKVPRKIRFV